MAAAQSVADITPPANSTATKNLAIGFPACAAAVMTSTPLRWLGTAQIRMHATLSVEAASVAMARRMVASSSVGA
jgi:hypothetical protein